MSISNPNLPKSILALRTYTAQMFLHDLLAGITVGLVALPLAMAFGIASGVTPQAGLYTAIVAGFILLFMGFTGLGAAVRFIPRMVVVGFHQRHRHPYRLYPDQGLLRPPYWRCSQRVLSAREAARRQLRQLQSVRARSRARYARHSGAAPALHPPPPKPHSDRKKNFDRS